MAALQWLVLAAAAAVLPVRLLLAPGASASAHPNLALAAALGASVGLPFFALSANGPLLQSWLAKSAPRAEPYRLYAAGNVGSLLALAAYPILVEPRLGLAAQGKAWSAGYLALVVMIAAVALSIPKRAGERAAGLRLVIPRPRLKWLFLAAVPSGLTLAVTTVLVNEVAPIPFLWTAPLAVYLLTMALAFGRHSDRVRALGSKAVPAASFIWAVALLADVQRPLSVVIPLHLGVLFLVGAACHGELYRERPPAEELTGYFLWVALGGALGGVFAGLAGPALLNSLSEGPLLMLAAALASAPPETSKGGYGFRHVVSALAVGALTALLLLRMRDGGLSPVLAAAAVAGVFILWVPDRPARFGAALGAALLLVALRRSPPSDVLFAKRTFFGMHRVTEEKGGGAHFLMHGNTVHGVERSQPPWRGEPLAYYARSGPAGELFEAFAPRLTGARIAVVGLGAGSLAAYAKPGQDWTFYEIDPVVERIAEDASLFTFLRDCAAPQRTVLGDARLSLVSAPEKAYSLLVVDAFGSDAVPTHLLTREAIALYFSKLADHGVLAFHVTNRYLSLEPVLAALASDAGLAAASKNTLVDEQALGVGILPSRWVVLARDGADLAPLTAGGRWHETRSRSGVSAWTDDFTDLLSVLKR
jgi:hypothetical protein